MRVESSNKSELNAADTWQKVLVCLRGELSEQSFRAWFEPIVCDSISSTEITLHVPDKFFGDWIRDHYQDILRSTIEEVAGIKPEVVFSTAHKMPAVFSSPEKKPSPSASSSAPARAENRLPEGINAKYSFDSFVVGPNNRFSHAAALAVSESPGKAYNPLFVYGPVGLGKTHLLQAIAYQSLRLRPDIKLLYISGERFTNLLISAIQNRSTESFRQKFRSLDLLLIDDVHFLAGKESTQEEFFHTFNTLYDAHKQIVVSSDRPPKDIPTLEERLVSRFGWGLITDIQAPDLETRIAILKKKIEQTHDQIPDDVVFFIANRVKSNIRELEGALVRVTAYCSLTNTPVTLRTAEDILRATVSEEGQKISIDLVQTRVADFFHLKASDLRAKRRTKSVAFPRQIAMYLIREMTSYSLPEIGDYFGGRDHATVLHAWKKIKKQNEADPAFSRLLADVKTFIHQP